MDFKQCLQKGKNAEIKVLKIIQKKYPFAKVINGKFCKYDIYVPEVNKTIEVKYQEDSKYNFVIEIASCGKRSGLLITKADFWVIFDGKHYYWIAIKNLWKCIDDHNMIPKAFNVKSGDKKLKEAYLIPKQIFRSYSDCVIRQEAYI